MTGTVLPNEMSVVLSTIAKTIAYSGKRFRQEMARIFPYKNCVQFPLSTDECRWVGSKAGANL
jgi:hypothetical protein